MNKSFHSLSSVGRLSGLIALSALFSSLALASPGKSTFGQGFPVNYGSSKVAGALSPNQPLDITVSLSPRDPAAFEAFVHNVSDPKSPLYRQFLSPFEVGAKFGATQQTVDATVAYLKANGFKIKLAAPNRMAIIAEGTVGKAETAFGVQLVNMVGPNPVGPGTYTYRCFTSAPKVPSGLAGSIINIEGLDTSSRPKPMTQTLTPALHKGLYDLNPIFNAGHTGLGRTVGVTNWGDNYQLNNISLFYNHFGLPVPSGGLLSNVHVIKFAGGSTGAAGGETDLDMQLELAQAPLAELWLYDDNINSASGNHVALLTQEGTDNHADLFSESWGWSGIGGSTATSLHNAYLAFGAQGTTYMCASGDNGARDSFDYPDFDPAVLVVGGTVATVDNTTGARISEVGWSGSGGGYSNKSVSFNVLPSWQVGQGIPTNLNFRLFPDIAGHASGGGGAYIVYWNGGLAGFIGTSLSSPSMAGSLAIVEQRLISVGLLPPDGNGKRRMGHMQELIYGQNGRADVYYDVLTGGNGTLYNGQSSTCHPFWDTVTGWGCFDYEKFYESLLPSNVKVAPTTLTVNLGKVSSGDVNSLGNDDGNQLNICTFLIPNQASPVIQFVVDGTTTKNTLTSYSFDTKGKMTSGGSFTLTCEAFNFTSSTYDASASNAGFNTTFSTLSVPNSAAANQYRGAGGALRGRVKVFRVGPSAVALPCAAFEYTVWNVSGS